VGLSSEFAAFMQDMEMAPVRGPFSLHVAYMSW
jgi:hypothetical protein